MFVPWRRLSDVRFNFHCIIIFIALFSLYYFLWLLSTIPWARDISFPYPEIFSLNLWQQQIHFWKVTMFSRSGSILSKMVLCIEFSYEKKEEGNLMSWWLKEEIRIYLFAITAYLTYCTLQILHYFTNWNFFATALSDDG